MLWAIRDSIPDRGKRFSFLQNDHTDTGAHPAFYSISTRVVVCFLLGNSPASEFYMPTFRNTLFHFHRQVGACRIYTHLPAYEDGTEWSETSAYKIQTPGNHQKESIQHSRHDESLTSGNTRVISREFERGDCI